MIYLTGALVLLLAALFLVVVAVVALELGTAGDWRRIGPKK